MDSSDISNRLPGFGTSHEFRNVAVAITVVNLGQYDTHGGIKAWQICTTLGVTHSKTGEPHPPKSAVLHCDAE